jgi:hypothetical protein
MNLLKLLQSIVKVVSQVNMIIDLLEEVLTLLQGLHVDDPTKQAEIDSLKTKVASIKKV